MNALAIPEQAALVAETQGNATALERLEAMQIDSPEQLAVAGEMLVAVKTRWKQLEERRVHLKEPSLEACRRVDALFNETKEPYARAEKILKEKIAARMLAQSAAQLQAVMAVEAGASTALVIPEQAPAGTSVREVWTYVIEDAALIPRKFLAVDHAALKRHCAFADTERTPPLAIQGVRFERVGKVTVRTA